MGTDVGARVLGALVAALVSVAAARGVEPVEVVGEWRVEGGGSRRVVLDGTSATLQVTWPRSGEQVSLVGAAREGLVFLREVVPETPGLAGALEGRPAGRRPARTVEVRVRSTTEDGGAMADALFREGQRFVTAERWSRPGRPKVEVLALEPQVGWCPKDGPLTVRFRVQNAPLRLRLRVVVAPSDGEVDARRVAFYMGKVDEVDGRPTRRIVREVDLGAPFEPGEHEVTYDGRDSTGDRRLLLGGRYRVVLLGDGDLRDEMVMMVAPPRTEYVGPRWPRRVDEGGVEVDAGRDRGVAHSMISSRVEPLALGQPDRTHLGGVSREDAVEALSRAAMVTIATHGCERALNFYTAPEDAVERPDHVAWLQLRHLDALAEQSGDERPFADLHTVVVWACLAGKRELPERLVELGADIVVAFTTQIASAGHELFMIGLLEAAVAESKERPGCLKGALEVGRNAAHRADQVWRSLAREDPGEYARLWAKGLRPLEGDGVLRIVGAANIDLKVEPLAPGRWGCSTN